MVGLKAGIAHIRDQISWGLNRTAQHLGDLTDAYRPTGGSEPLAAENRYLRLRAAFSPTSGDFSRPQSYGSASYYGYFDSAYTRPGDYLVQAARTFFVAEQDDLLPVLCIRANRCITISRATVPTSGGPSLYGGGTADNYPLISNWPVSMLGSGAGGQPSAGLPGDQSVSVWTVLLPAPSGVVFRPSDRLSDDLGREALITGAELSHLGWRLVAKQVTT